MKRSSNSRIWNEARTRMAISSSGWSSPRSRASRCSCSISSPMARASLAVPGAGDLHLLAQHIFRTQRLAETAFIVRDQERGGREDVAGRAVVPLETDDLGAREVVIEAQDVVDFGPSPAVNRLVVVADATDVLGLSLFRARWKRKCGFRRRSRAARLRDNGRRRRRTGHLRQQLQPQILRDVRVLVLVDQNELEALLK